MLQWTYVSLDRTVFTAYIFIKSKPQQQNSLFRIIWFLAPFGIHKTNLFIPILRKVIVSGGEFEIIIIKID